MKILRKLAVIFVAIILLCGSVPLAVFAASFDFNMSQNYGNLAAGDTVQLHPTSTASGITYQYTSLDTSVATISSTGKLTAKKAGTAQIQVTGTLGVDTVTKILDIEILGKLKISSNTTLDKRLGDSQFTMQVSFNVRKDYVTYSFSIYDDDIATIDEDTGRVKIKAVGETTILVEAYADGYQDASKEFALTVAERESISSGRGTGELVLNGGATTAAAAAANDPYKGFKFTGKVVVNGTKFSTTNNLSAGTEFAIKTGDNNGDWWRSPDAFTGSRGIYTAKNAGVSELIYADTEGKTYSFKINSYKLVKYSNFMIPERIPVGAMFSVPAPTDQPGIWGKDESMLSGNGGTYIPLKAGKTTLSYTTKDLKYSVTITIVDDTPADTADSGVSSGGNTGNNINTGTVMGDPSSETPTPPAIIILN